MVRLTCGYGKPDSGCGHQWEYRGDKAVTSCPNCGNRVRTGAPIPRTRDRMASPQNLSSRSPEQTKYW